MTLQEMMQGFGGRVVVCGVAPVVKHEAARAEMMGALCETGDEYRAEELIGGRLVKREY